MELEILVSKDPAFVLSRARLFLSSQPVLHNLVLSILQERIAHAEDGRYWIAIETNVVLGVAIQSPLHFPIILTPMQTPVATAMADAIALAGITLPGVTADAATAANFAGQWSERSKSAAIPYQGLRLYELLAIGEIPVTEGSLRRAKAEDRNLMIVWTRAFQKEVNESEHDTELRVDRALEAGKLWLWDQGGETVTMALTREPIHGVVRLSGVYTPPEKRKHGHAARCVYVLSRQLADAGYRCILYTDLGNPTSNSIYRRIGYRAVAETLRYRFK